MAKYPQLDFLTRQVANGSSPSAWHAAIDYLIDVWLDDYAPAPGTRPEIVETTTGNFSYLFDIASGRLIAAYGVSRGKNTEARPAARMKDHPLGGPKGYHRGHAIPHTLGGATDINLVPQLGSVNVGPFRALEKQAVATPGSFYFTYWRYLSSPAPRAAAPSQVQRPIAVDQGLLLPAVRATVTTHRN